VEALADHTPDIRYYPNLAVEKSLDTWVFGDRITLIGDAAHAHGGAYATGGSLAIDDAYALSLAISSIFPPTNAKSPTSETIGEALRLYENTGKPHADRLLGIVHNANKKKVANTSNLATDEALRNRAAERPNTGWLHEHDVVEAFNKALENRKSD
jgi:salicylate hydroxylase